VIFFIFQFLYSKKNTNKETLSKPAAHAPACIQGHQKKSAEVKILKINI
jgi:hypothetical protein